MSEWQPIETAPKETRVVVYEPEAWNGDPFVRDMRKQVGCLMSSNFDPPQWSSWPGRPTHWMPLPSPPVEEGRTTDDVVTRSGEFGVLPAPQPASTDTKG